MTYVEFRERQQREINDFPMAAAFSEKQLEEAMQKLNVQSPKELVHVAGGMLIRRDDQKDLLALLKRHDDEWKQAMKNDDLLQEAFIYEMGNHEYCLTMDREDTLNALQITDEEFLADIRLRGIFSKAEKEYLKSAGW